MRRLYRVLSMPLLTDSDGVSFFGLKLDEGSSNFSFKRSLLRDLAYSDSMRTKDILIETMT
jgi:hypothetical protein